MSCAHKFVSLSITQLSRACLLYHLVPCSHMLFPLALLACALSCALTAVSPSCPVVARHARFQGASPEETRPHDSSHHMTGQHGTEQAGRMGQDRTGQLRLQGRARIGWESECGWEKRAALKKPTVWYCSTLAFLAQGNSSSLRDKTLLRQCTTMRPPPRVGEDPVPA